MSATQPPTKLTDCESREVQSAWIKRALRKGHTVSDSGLWLGGVDRPQELIAQLRTKGLTITTTKKRVVDAADQAHMDLAWKLES
jgi:hypothetical protein